MSNYNLMRLNKTDRNILTPQNTSYSKEYCDAHCDLYLTEQLDRNEDGKSQRNYRLHARAAHTPEMALAYEIKCPKCGNTLKQIARQRTLTDLGLYTCKCCNK